MKYLSNFSAIPEADKFGAEQYDRLVSVFGKNKIGYHTRFMADFEIFLEAVLNERFIDESTLYYDDFFTQLEIEDVEAGLSGELDQSDVRHLNRDKPEAHADSFSAWYYPDRVGTNYDKSDALSCYKIMPKGQKPLV
jgi:hypothetical protein